jgi:hypothetical protein
MRTLLLPLSFLVLAGSAAVVQRQRLSLDPGRRIVHGDPPGAEQPDGGILALDNADLQDHDPSQSDRRLAYNGHGLAIVRAGGPGVLRLTATSPRRTPAGVAIRVLGGRPTPVVPPAR